MAKDPAFLFYSSDFLTGTMFMSDEQVGKYIRLLCAQHQKGILSEKDMLIICKTYDKDIFDKFDPVEGGYLNKRLSDETEKRKNYSKSRSENRKGKHMNNISKTYVQHMENENENENVIDNDIIDNNYVTVANGKVKHQKVLEFYEAQLNGTQSEYSLPAWKPLVNNWFLEHLQENFQDNDHLKNSFKKWYINRKPKAYQKERTKLL
jgi:uncharacterized protein YdaU (DUF1376 family)